MAPWKWIFINRFDLTSMVSLGKMLLLSWLVVAKYHTPCLLHIFYFPQQVCLNTQATHLWSLSCYHQPPCEHSLCSCFLEVVISKSVDICHGIGISHLVDTHHKVGFGLSATMLTLVMQTIFLPLHVETRHGIIFSIGHLVDIIVMELVLFQQPSSLSFSH